MSHPTLAPYIIKRPWLMRWMKPLSEWYFDNAGYRKLGLRYVMSWKESLLQDEDYHHTRERCGKRALLIPRPAQIR